MKKALTLIIIAALLLCGCAGKAKTEPEVTPETTPEITSGAASESTVAQDAEASADETVSEHMEWDDEQIDNQLLKERFAQIDESEHEKYIQEYYSQRFSGKSWYDYADQIDEDGERYTLEGGRISNYPMALGERHEHMDCDSTDAELMALGRKRLAAAVKIDTLINGLAMRDLSNELPVEGWDEGYYALDESVGTYDSIIELYRNTFSPESKMYYVYYSVSQPAELLKHKFVPECSVLDALKASMLVHDGVTYETGTGLTDTRNAETKLCGVLSHTDTHIEYGLCTMVFDEEGEMLMDELGIHYDRPQVRYEHSVMKLDLIDGQWLITQIRDCLGQYPDFIDIYGYEF